MCSSPSKLESVSGNDVSIELKKTPLSGRIGPTRSRSLPHSLDFLFEAIVKPASGRFRRQSEFWSPHLLDHFTPLGVTGKVHVSRPLGEVPCSQVPWQHAEGVLGPPPTTRTASKFCPYWDSNQEPSAVRPQLTELPSPRTR